LLGVVVAMGGFEWNGVGWGAVLWVRACLGEGRG